MKWSSGLAFLSALRGRETTLDGDDDHADMGTAFGLDASFGPVDAEPAAGAGEVQAQPWEARLIRRSGL
jgi:hypothetical protein